MRPPSSTKMRPASLVTVVLVVLIASTFYVTLGSFAYQNALRHDFLSFYAGAQQVNSGDTARLYDPQVQLEYQKKLYPDHEEVVPFIRPRFYAELLRPFTNWHQPTALLVWQAVQAAFYLSALALILLRFPGDYLLIASLSITAPLGIANGQDCGFMAFLAALSLHLYFKNKLLLSGLALGIAVFKWHLLLLLPLAMMLGRQYILLGGFLAGAAAMALLDFALAGWSGWQAYAAILTRGDLERLNPGVQLMPNLRGIFTNLAIPRFWWLGLALVLPSFALCALRLSWPHALLATQLATILVVPHAYLYDLAYTIYPTIALLASGIQGRLKWAAFLTVMPIIPFMNMTWPPWTGFLGMLLLFFLISYGLAAMRRDPALQ